MTSVLSGPFYHNKCCGRAAWGHQGRVWGCRPRRPAAEETGTGPEPSEWDNRTNPACLGSPGEGCRLQRPAPSSSDRSRLALRAIWPKKGTPDANSGLFPPAFKLRYMFWFSANWMRFINASELFILTERNETHTQYSWIFTHSTQALNADKHKKCYTLRTVGVQKLSYSISESFGSTLKIPSDRIHRYLLQRLLHEPTDFTYQSFYEAKTENLNKTTKEKMRWHQQSKPNKILREKNWTNNIPNAACIKTNKKRLINILQSTLCLTIWQKEQLLSVSKIYL